MQGLKPSSVIKAKQAIKQVSSSESENDSEGAPSTIAKSSDKVQAERTSNETEASTNAKISKAVSNLANSAGLSSSSASNFNNSPYAYGGLGGAYGGLGGLGALASGAGSLGQAIGNAWGERGARSPQRGGGGHGGGGCQGGGCHGPGNGGGGHGGMDGLGGGQGLDPKTNQAATGIDKAMNQAGDKPLLVKFGAPWCTGCNAFDAQHGITQGGQKTDIPGATLHDKGNHAILKVNVDQNSSLAGQIGVNTSTIPALGYVYRKKDGSLGIAQNLNSAQQSHTKAGDVVKPKEDKPPTLNSTEPPIPDPNERPRLPGPNDPKPRPYEQKSPPIPPTSSEPKTESKLLINLQQQVNNLNKDKINPKALAALKEHDSLDCAGGQCKKHDAGSDASYQLFKDKQGLFLDENKMIHPEKPEEVNSTFIPFGKDGANKTLQEIIDAKPIPKPTSSSNTTKQVPEPGESQATESNHFKPVTSMQDLDKELSEAAEQGQTVFMKYGADWCTNCSKYDKNVKPDLEQAYSEDHSVRMLAVDLTNSNGFNKKQSATLLDRVGGSLPAFEAFKLIEGELWAGEFKGENKQLSLEESKKMIEEEKKQ